MLYEAHSEVFRKFDFKNFHCGVGKQGSQSFIHHTGVGSEVCRVVKNGEKQKLNVGKWTRRVFQHLEAISLKTEKIRENYDQNEKEIFFFQLLYVQKEVFSDLSRIIQILRSSFKYFSKHSLVSTNHSLHKSFLKNKDPSSLHSDKYSNNGKQYAQIPMMTIINHPHSKLLK